MNLMRLIILLLVVWIAMRMLRRLTARPAAPEPARHGTVQAEDTVRCVRCGLYLPRSEALTEGDRYFCCPEHRS